MTLLTDSLVTDLGYGLPLAEKIENACLKYHGLIDDHKRVEDHINGHGEASLAYVFDKMNIGE